MSDPEPDVYPKPDVCPICGEEPEWQHCTECHAAAAEGREAHPDWDNKD